MELSARRDEFAAVMTTRHCSPVCFEKELGFYEGATPAARERDLTRLAGGHARSDDTVSFVTLVFFPKKKADAAVSRSAA